MKRVKGTSNFEEKGRMGLAYAVKLSATTMRVDFEATETTKSASFPINVVQGTEDRTIPDYFPFNGLKINGKLGIKATMNVDGTKLLFATPSSGDFQLKFEKFPSAENTPPAPETHPGKKAGTTYQAFGAMFEIAEGRWKGAKFFSRFYPNFAPDEDGLLAVSGTGDGSNKLFDFLQVTGVSEHVIKYSENPLPEIQEIAQKEGRIFKGIVQKGWIDTLTENLDEEDLFEDVPNATPETVVSEAEEDVDDIHPALK